MTNTISPQQTAEIERFERELVALEHGERDPDDFKRFRLENGVYGIRGTADRHMIRIKICFGALTADQLDAVAGAADRFTPLQQGHITTRQAIQLHNIERRNVPALLRIIAESGLTTREACGNTVRNVTCCPLAGVAAGEAFDVAPYANAVSAFFLRNPLNQNLPRKFKIAFEGCPTDHIRIGIHDFGVIAKLQDGRRGFQLFAGGGLGPTPFSAQPLEDWTPEELLFPSIEAVLRLFDRHGNRKDRNRARLKFVVKDWGIEEFRKQWRVERQIAVMTRSGAANWTVPVAEETAPISPSLPPANEPTTPAYRRWRETNCIEQKQAGFVAVHVRCPLGDITAEQMRAVAGIARRYGGGRLRTTIAQNLMLRWVPVRWLPNVYAELTLCKLAGHDAEHIADITRCPGADTCQIAITHSRGLAQALGEMFHNGLAADPVFENLSIKISGCPNSCGQHHIADIGFFGNAKTIDGHSVGHYRMLLGGRTEAGHATFAVPVLSLPAKRIPDAIKELLLHYREHRGVQESFHDFVQRIGLPHIKQMLDKYTTLPPYSERPDLYGDLGIEGEFKVQLGKGECAA